MTRWGIFLCRGAMRGRATLIQALQAGAHWRKGSYASGIETDFQVSNKVTPGNFLRGKGYSYNCYRRKYKKN